MGELPCKPIKGKYYHCWVQTLYVGIAQYERLGKLHFLDSSIPKGMELLYLDFTERGFLTYHWEEPPSAKFIELLHKKGYISDKELEKLKIELL